MRSKPTLLLYCQHSLGLGHLTRSWALADALAANFRVVVLMGGAAPPGLSPPHSIEVLALPPLGQSSSGDLVSLDSHYTIDDAKRVRQQTLVETFRTLRPDVLVIELFPFGRKKFAFELVPLLDFQSRLCHWRSLVLCSVRDILVSRGTEQQDHDERARIVAERHFDAVLVHSDPALANLDDTFRPRTPMRVPVYYTGFIAPGGVRVRPEEPRREVVVSAGGGRVGEPLFRAAIDAYDLLWPTERLPMKIIAGPFLPDDVWQSLIAGAHDRPGLRFERTVPDLCGELSCAAASVSQFGYNTALDILRARVPALVVPFGEGHEDEQRSRALRLEQLGVVRVLQPKDLEGRTLAAEIMATLAFQPRAAHVDLNGTDRTVRLVGELLCRRTVRRDEDQIAVNQS